jgi:hypothetical protein
MPPVGHRGGPPTISGEVQEGPQTLKCPITQFVIQQRNNCNSTPKEKPPQQRR